MTLSYDDLHTYQDSTIEYLYEHDRLLAMLPVGAGKTVISLTAFVELQEAGVVRRTVVVAPKLVAAETWPDELEKWGHLAGIKMQVMHGKDPTKTRVKKFEERADVYTISMNSLPWLAKQVKLWRDDDPRLDLLIVDEVSRCKDPSGSWAKALRYLGRRFRHVWLLTGSPRPNSELEYFVYTAVITNDKMWGKSFTRWQRKNFYPEDYMQYKWTVHEFMKDKINDDVASISVQVPLSEIPRPASDPILHEVELPPELRRMYDTMERQLFAKLSETEAIIAFNAAVSSGKLSQLCQGFLYEDEQSKTYKYGDKLAYEHSYRTEKLNEIIEASPGDPFLIIYWFKADLWALRQVVPELQVLGADTKEDEASRIKADWNAGKIKRLAIHPASAGHGLNLQGVPAQLVHYSMIWSAELYEQVVGRVARQGYAGSDVVMNHMIVAKDTVDECKFSRVSHKITEQNAALAYIKKVQDLLRQS